MVCCFCGVSTVLGDKVITGRIRNDLQSPCASLLVSLACLVISGNPPGVLFLVTRRCSRGLSFSLRFAVGLRDCIIAGASVMRGMVRIGVLSNTLCWFSLATLCSFSLTLCSSWTMCGFNVSSIFLCSAFTSRLPAGMAFASSTASINASVSARKCCCFVKHGIWQCCGNNSVDPDILYALVSGMK
jgi:hypothetical protein